PDHAYAILRPNAPAGAKLRLLEITAGNRLVSDFDERCRSISVVPGVDFPPHYLGIDCPGTPFFAGREPLAYAASTTRVYALLRAAGAARRGSPGIAPKLQGFFPPADLGAKVAVPNLAAQQVPNAAAPVQSKLPTPVQQVAPQQRPAQAA